MGARNPYLTARLQGFGTTIFAEMSALAVEHDAVNLDQGFPDTDGPDVVKQAAIDAIRDGHNQYAPGAGVAALRHAVADHQQRFHGLAYDPDTEITATAGATEAVFSALQALLDVGDEVLTFEPFYGKVGVVAVPTSGLYLHPARGRHLARFAFCKTDAVLDEGVERLRGL